MCNLLPLGCALRDNHQGQCLATHQLEAAVTNLSSHLDDELDITLGHHQHRQDHP